jgi:hypothetical protein
MNTCSICKHENREEIEASIARGDSLRDIARQFQSNKDSVSRHQQCMIKVLQEASQVRVDRTQTVIEKEVDSVFEHVNRLLRACHKWLLDPDNPEEYTLDARTGEISVIYEEEEGEFPNGDPKYKKKRGLLSTLDRIKNCRSTVSYS